jgi:hypothetical protein
MPVPKGIGQNPMNGVILDYYLKEKADTNKVKLEIIRPDGKLIRTYSNIKDESFKPYPGGPPAPVVIPADAGVNRFAWDFRRENIQDVPNAYVYGNYKGYQVAPGKYKARVTYKGTSSETEFEIIPDPRIKASASEWSAQQQFLTDVEGRIEEIHNAINAMRKVKKQVDTYNEMLKSKKEAKEVVDAGKALIKKMTTWESNLIETRQKNGQDVINWPSKLNTEYFQLLGVADVHEPALTQGVKDRYKDLESQWATYKQQMEDLISKDIAAYNTMFKAKNIPAVVTESK